VEYNYFYGGYNVAWMTERSVEIPLILKYVQAPDRGRLLEIGNVLSHYVPRSWDVLDKFEVGPGVMNADIVDFQPEQRYDLIVSISTIEHVGFDDDVEDPARIPKAIERIRRDCLNPGGLFVATFPVGYNPHLDALLYDGRLGFEECRYLKRVSMSNRWAEVSANEAAPLQYNHPYPLANGLAVATFRRGCEQTKGAA
jgi:hypothetical protein